MSELDRLRDRVAELEDAMGLTAEIPRELIPPMSAHHYPAVRRVMSILLARPFGNRDAIYDSMFGALPESKQPGMKILDVYIHEARKSLKPHGIVIQTVRGDFGGWYLDNENKAKLRAVIERLNHEQQAAA